MNSQIQLLGVNKFFKRKKVLDDINLTINHGEIIGLLGKNGAGKSTLIRIMTGLLTPSDGKVLINGRPVISSRKLLSIAPQTLGIYPNLTVKQNLLVFAQLNGLNRLEAKKREKQILQLFSLSNFVNKRAGVLSGGQKHRLHSAIALMSNADIFFFDEPTVGADINSRKNIIMALKKLALKGKTIVYTTHYLEEMEQLNARIVFINNCKIREDLPVKEFVQKHASSQLKVEFDDKVILKIPGWISNGNNITITNFYKTVPQLISDVLKISEEHHYKIINIKNNIPTLEQAYLNLMSLEDKNEN